MTFFSQEFAEYLKHCVALGPRTGKLKWAGRGQPTAHSTGRRNTSLARLIPQFDAEVVK